MDVGGYRMHIYCLGSGSPTVVSDAGLGDFSLTWDQRQAELARLSSRGTLVIVEESGHYIQLDQPQLVIDAILEVLEGN